MKAKEYLAFTKRERSGIISLIILVLIVVIIPKFFDGKQKVVEKISMIEIQDTLKNKKTEVHKKFEPPRYVKKKIEPFEINKADTSAAEAAYCAPPRRTRAPPAQRQHQMTSATAAR